MTASVYVCVYVCMSVRVVWVTLARLTTVLEDYLSWLVFEFRINASAKLQNINTDVFHLFSYNIWSCH